jgi:hypothetical protein
MAPIWFENRKLFIYLEMTFLYVGINGLIYKFAHEMFLFFLITTTATALIWWLSKRKNFSRRDVGFVIEQNAVAWLEKELAVIGIKVRKGIRMKYGDIDIHLPQLRVVIDVKAFGQIDQRVMAPKILASVRRQIDFTGARLGIIWLPRSKQTEIKMISGNVYVVSGKENLLKFFEEKGL